MVRVRRRSRAPNSHSAWINFGAHATSNAEVRKFQAEKAKPKRQDEDAEKVLLALTNDHPNAHRIARDLKVSIQRIDLILDALQTAGLVETFFGPYDINPTTWQLTTKGKRYLVEYGLVK